MYRNPSTGVRPKFREVLLTLIDDQECVLAIPQQDLDTHPLAGVLGSPLEAGDGMYSDLKLKYQSSSSRPLQHTVIVQHS